MPAHTRSKEWHLLVSGSLCCVLLSFFSYLSILSNFFSHNHTLNRQIIPGAPLTHFNEVGEGGGGGGVPSDFFGSEILAKSIFFWGL